MKKQDFKTNFKTKEEGELTETLVAKREALRVFRFSAAGSAPRDLQKMRAGRKDVARICTALRARSPKA